MFPSPLFTHSSIPPYPISSPYNNPAAPKNATTAAPAGTPKLADPAPVKVDTVGTAALLVPVAEEEEESEEPVAVAVLVAAWDWVAATEATEATEAEAEARRL